MDATILIKRRVGFELFAAKSLQYELQAFE